MSNPMPLNGNRPIQAIHRALSGSAVQQPSAADIIRQLHDDPEEAEELMRQDVPDGTNGATKDRATDPSQGHGNSSPGRPADPLLDALKKLPSVGGF